MAEDICNGDMMYWEFILVGNDYDNYIQEQIDKVQQLGERHKGLTQNTKEGRKKVYIRKWSDILRVEQGHKMKYLKEKLLLRYAKPEDRSSQEIVSKLSD